MKVVIAGKRTILDSERLFKLIDETGFNITEVVSGHCAGPDIIGENWAIKNNIPCQVFKADLVKHSHAAGPMRNKQMAEHADALILFWDGESKGSKSMLKEARKHNILIEEHIIKD